MQAASASPSLNRPPATVTKPRTFIKPKNSFSSVNGELIEGGETRERERRSVNSPRSAARERGEKRSAETGEEEEESSKRNKMSKEDTTTKQMLAALTASVKEIKDNQVRREDVVSRKDVKNIVKNVIDNRVVGKLTDLDQRVTELERKQSTSQARSMPQPKAKKGAVSVLSLIHI